MFEQNTAVQNFPIGMAYVPMQKLDKRYSDNTAITRGTLFPSLDLPFKNYVIQGELPQNPLYDVMKHDFVCFDLGLYLDTHPNDKEAISYYNQCVLKSDESRKNYEQHGGQLMKSNSYARNSNWVDNPWPWDVE